VVEDGAVDLGIPGLTDAVEVARGGFSTVFRARQSAMERTVAVKLIHATVVDPVAGEHFLREVRATGRLSQHPNVAPVYDVGTTATGQPYLIMPYYERGSLEQRLTSGGALSEAYGGNEPGDMLKSMIPVGIRLSNTTLVTTNQVGIFRSRRLAHLAKIRAPI